MTSRVFAILALGVLAACSKPADPDLAEQVVPQFHMALNDQTFEAFYDETSPELKQEQSKQEYVAYIRAVRERLGEVSATQRKAKKVEGSRVTLTYHSTYALSEASEEFVVHVDADQTPRLVRYRLLAPPLQR